MTGMLGHPVAENPIDRMFNAVYAHYRLPWQFRKNDIATEADLALAARALVPLGYRGMGITVPYKVAVIALLDAVDADVTAIGAAIYLTIENGRLIGHNNDGKGVVMLGAGGAGRAMAVQWATVDPRCTVVDGVEMLVQLAMQIFQRWTGITPEEAVFQQAVAEALGE